jgi:hypothetical protein
VHQAQGMPVEQPSTSGLTRAFSPWTERRGLLEARQAVFRTRDHGRCHSTCGLAIRALDLAEHDSTVFCSAPSDRLRITAGTPAFLKRWRWKLGGRSAGRLAFSSYFPLDGHCPLSLYLYTSSLSFSLFFLFPFSFFFLVLFIVPSQFLLILYFLFLPFFSFSSFLSLSPFLTHTQAHNLSHRKSEGSSAAVVVPGAVHQRNEAGPSAVKMTSELSPTWPGRWEQGSRTGHVSRLGAWASSTQDGGTEGGGHQLGYRRAGGKLRELISTQAYMPLGPTGLASSWNPRRIIFV